jgi:rhamnosyltransferase
VISVVIPVKDGGDRIRRCLQAVRAQEVDDEVEVIIVDSGSTDGTVELCRSLGARVHEIPPAEFNHGATRNRGAELSQGEIVVFTVDDALPVGDRWLEALVAPLRAPGRLAATYSRQIAYDEAPPHQRLYIEHRYGPRARVQSAASEAELSVGNVLFSNVSSAIPADVLAGHPFASDIVIAEDLEWCARVLLAGYEVAYVPESVVRHSHVYSLGGTVKRYFDQGAAANLSFMSRARSSPAAVRSEGLRFVRSELGSMWRSGERAAIPAALAHEAARFTGFQLGVHHRRVPAWLRRRISRTPVYWDR